MNNNLLMQELENLKKEFEGYHIDITLYPSGGRIDIIGCNEYGTDDDIYETSSWRYDNTKRSNIYQAIDKIKTQLKDYQQIGVMNE